MADTNAESTADQQPPASREFLTPGLAILIPLIIGAALLVVGIKLSHRFVTARQQNETREHLEKARGLLRKSLDSLREKDYPAAESWAGQAVALVPDLATGYVFRAEGRAGQGKQKSALADYTRALQLDPDTMDAYNAFYGRGQVHARLGMHNEAVEDFSAALKLQPHRAEGYLSRAAARKRLGDMDGYERDLRRAKELGLSVVE